MLCLATRGRNAGVGYILSVHGRLWLLAGTCAARKTLISELDLAESLAAEVDFSAERDAPVDLAVEREAVVDLAEDLSAEVDFGKTLESDTGIVC